MGVGPVRPPLFSLLVDLEVEMEDFAEVVGPFVGLIALLVVILLFWSALP